MKRLLRILTFHLISLYTATLLLGASFVIEGGIVEYLFAASVLGLLNMCLKPILKLLFFPINALTLGLFSLVIHAGVFFLFMRLVPFITLTPWIFPGTNLFGVAIPAIALGFWGTLGLVSVVTALITNFLLFLVK